MRAGPAGKPASLLAIWAVAAISLRRRHKVGCSGRDLGMQTVAEINVKPNPEEIRAGLWLTSAAAAAANILLSRNSEGFDRIVLVNSIKYMK